MSTDVPGPWAPRGPTAPASPVSPVCAVSAVAPARPVLAGWALGLTLSAPLLVLVPWLGFGLGRGTALTVIAGLGPLLAVPAGLAGGVLGLVALARARRGGAGLGLAVSAVVISALEIVAVIVTVIVPFLFLFVVFALGGFE